MRAQAGMQRTASKGMQTVIGCNKSGNLGLDNLL
jgi:hypothetical protein